MKILAKGCTCVTHEGPCEDHQRQMTKARRQEDYARIMEAGKQPGYTRAQSEQAKVLLEYNVAEAQRDLADHVRWMHRLGIAAFCRTCWQGFTAEELPANCACGGTFPTQPKVDLLAMAARLDIAGKWPPEAR